MSINKKYEQRILFIENSVSHRAPGGSHKSLINIYDSLDFEVYRPYILLNEKSEILTQLFKDRDTLYLNHPTFDNLPKFKFGFSKKNDYKNRNKYIFLKKMKENLGIIYRIFRDTIPMTIKTVRIIKKLDIDLVHTNTRIGSNQFGILAAWICRKKIISHERMWTKSNWFNNIILKIPDRIICISRSIKDNLLSIGVKSERCEVIFNGRAFNHVPDSVLDKYDEKFSGNFKIGLMANICEYKGHTVFVRSAVRLLKKYPNFKFYIYGDLLTPEQKYLQSLKEIIREKNFENQIIFKGYVKNVNSIIQNLHINCCLTIGEEPLSGTIIESLINKTVIIATNTGGSGELIKDNINGLLIKPNSVESFIACVERIYKNKIDAKKIVNNGYEFARSNLSTAIYAKKVSNVYKKIL